jgi:hypothetical protein
MELKENPEILEINRITSSDAGLLPLSIFEANCQIYL